MEKTYREHYDAAMSTSSKIYHPLQSLGDDWADRNHFFTYEINPIITSFAGQTN